MRALHRVLMDQDVRERMKRRSQEQSRRFSWESSARRVLQVYEEVAGKGSSESGSEKVGETVVNS
jgi:glycosyltransferase involved in cell wall biosynthesis